MCKGRKKLRIVQQGGEAPRDGYCAEYGCEANDRVQRYSLKLKVVQVGGIDP